MALARDRRLMRAARKIRRRADRQPSGATLVETFYNPGFVETFETTDHQVIFGRRGTGKTHALRFLEERWESADAPPCVVYIDGRGLGSDTVWHDGNRPIHERVLTLFTDVFGFIYNDLADGVLDMPNGYSLETTEALENLRISFSEALWDSDEIEVTRTEERQTNRLRSVRGTTSPPTLDVSAKDKGSKKRSRLERATLQKQRKIVFPAVASLLAEVLSTSGGQLFVLFDEWNGIPYELQPFLAEFLRRSFAACPEATLKIATIGHRSRFATKHEGSLIGLELGGDITSSHDLDDYYILEADHQARAEIFGGLLYNHLSATMGRELLQERGVHHGRDLTSKLFEGDAFRDLTRASEGNFRDLFHIFCSALEDTNRRRRDVIGSDSVRKAARQNTYENKMHHLSGLPRQFIRSLLKAIHQAGKGNSFVVRSSYDRCPVIGELVDQRILHVTEKATVRLDDPGEIYTRYEVDFGLLIPLAEAIGDDVLRRSQECEETLGDEVMTCLDDVGEEV